MVATLPTIAFLGAGSMAAAIVNGLLDPAVVRSGPIRLTNRTTVASSKFAGRADVETWAVETDPDANRKAVDGANIVVVAVKPAMVVGVLDEIACALSPNTIVVSVAAGVTIATMEAHLPSHVGVVRTMPNTPARVGLGVTGIAVGTRATAAQLAQVVEMFATVGATIVLDEAKIDALSTISGSGPAYVFYFIEQLEAAAQALGFSPEHAALMVRNTFAGSLELLRESAEQPGDLRRQVTSPNGTTERAIAAFDDADLRGIFQTATVAALTRARQLAAGE